MAVQTPGSSRLPAEVEERYAGRWIAVRDGDVVADGSDYDELVAEDVVLPEDDVYHVGPAL